jgi:hypothetical protein
MKTGNLKLVKDLLVHSDLKTTERYAHLTEDSYKQAVASLNGLTSQQREDTKSQNVANGVILMVDYLNLLRLALVDKSTESTDGFQ